MLEGSHVIKRAIGEKKHVVDLFIEYDPKVEELVQL